jgi:hypothetical protein
MEMPFGFVINALSAFFLLPVCYRLLRLSYWRATRSRLPVRSHPPTRLLRMLEARSERTSAVAYYRSGMNGYKLHGHLSEQFFRATGGYFANLARSVGSISEETYSQQAVYVSYTSEPSFCDYSVYDNHH